jgi:OmpR-family two-component system manganese-sensing sensor histidine kinase
MVSSVAAIGWFLSGLAMQPIKESYQRLKQFTADASHELRNPIAVIQTSVQSAIAYPEPARQQQQLKVIERLTQRLGNLVNDLLFLARSDSEKVQLNAKPLPLDALLLEVIEEQRLSADQKEIFLTLQIEETQLETTQTESESFTLLGDWDQLARLFTNLISNALEYTASQTEKIVTVKLRSLKIDRLDYLQIEIKDTGVGIAEKDLPHLFDRFYRVDPARSHQNTRGTGLGLAIAQVIAENHQGKITVESALNKGTTFKVNLPVLSHSV